MSPAGGKALRKDVIQALMDEWGESGIPTAYALGLCEYEEAREALSRLSDKRAAQLSPQPEKGGAT